MEAPPTPTPPPHSRPHSPPGNTLIKRISEGNCRKLVRTVQSKVSGKEHSQSVTSPYPSPWSTLLSSQGPIQQLLLEKPEISPPGVCVCLCVCVCVCARKHTAVDTCLHSVSFYSLELASVTCISCVHVSGSLWAQGCLGTGNESIGWPGISGGLGCS